MFRFKRIMCALLCTCFIAVSFASYTANAISDNSEAADLQQQLAVLEQKNKQYQEVLDKTQSDINEKVQYKAALLGKIEVLDNKMALTHQAIDELNSSIDTAKLEIENANAGIQEQMNTLCQRIRTIYMSGNATDLEIILGAKNFSDFIDKVQLIRTLSNYDKKLIKEINAKLSVITEQKRALEDDKATLAEQQTNLETDQNDLNKLLQENEKLLSSLYSSNASAKASIQNAALESEEIEKKIQEYYASVAAKAAANASVGKKENVPEKTTDTDDNDNTQSADNGDVQDTTSSNSSSSDNTTNSDDNSSGNTSNTDSSSDNNNNTQNNEVTASGYTWPCPGYYYLSSEWNEDRLTYNHGAIDIAGAGIMGAAVVSADSGVVIAAYDGCIHNWSKTGSCGCGGGYGNYVMIDHGNGKMTVYGHFTSVAVSAGQSVSKGQTIGYVGSTGNSTGPHLHFECRLNGVKYNPMLEY
ncbi:MAG: peptidoglycan DD-metalloendopeptidase family protein [Ruminococcus sp.]|nr:peptidoglycan DD-metalloendopeptidase family protein [Ruminococcus sp.]